MNDLEITIHLLHEGTSAYATACFLSREKKLDSAELRRFAEGLMRSLSDSSLKRGAKVIGHIKAYIEHQEGFLHAHTVGEPGDITIDGRDGGPIDRFKLVVNSIIFGIPEEAVKDAADEAIRETSARFGLVQEPVGLTR
jgi:hypothetical protein